ncbi:MAG: NADH-quinone oxidoreductase subunit K [Phycisphaerales bacterium]
MSVAHGVFPFHAANIGILAMSGCAHAPRQRRAPPASPAPPIIGVAADPMVDPLPQALILTAIVISFATTAFLLTILVVTHRRTATLLVDELARIDRPAPPVATTIDA